MCRLGDEGFEILLRDIVEQGAADAKRPAGQRHLDLVLIVELGNAFAEQPDDMRRIGRRRDRHHGARLGDAVRGGEHRGAAEAVADQDRRRHERRPQMIGGGDQIVDIRRERGVGELALAGAEPGKIEAQHRDAVQLQPLGNMPRRPIALAAGEAMRKQRHRADRAIGPVEQRRERVALGVAEVEFFGGHGRLLRGLAFHMWIFSATFGKPDAAVLGAKCIMEIRA